MHYKEAKGSSYSQQLQGLNSSLIIFCSISESLKVTIISVKKKTRSVLNTLSPGWLAEIMKKKTVHKVIKLLHSH